MSSFTEFLNMRTSIVDNYIHAPHPVKTRPEPVALMTSNMGVLYGRMGKTDLEIEYDRMSL